MEDDGVPDENTEDLSYSDLDTFPEFLVERSSEIGSLHLDHNEITVLPRVVRAFYNLVSLDISNNRMTYMSPEVCYLQCLKTLIARNNCFENDSLPKELGSLQSLKVINFSGNRLTEFPHQFLSLQNLISLHLGANSISEIPANITNLQWLEVLYLGGNRLEEIPEEIGSLEYLHSLVLSDNRLLCLPRSLAGMRRLKSLSLHNNRLSTLPPELVKLDLVELSLRNNPLVVRFVQDMIFEPPSLLELAGRVVKVRHLTYSGEDLPRNLVEYLDAAQHCVNPKCKGVYFSSHVEKVKFVDFCGKYRLPLLQYLCSPRCTASSPAAALSSESESEEDTPVVSKMKKVLLG